METINKTSNECQLKCENLTMTCPNVKPYADGTKRFAHSEVKCNQCQIRWLWGLSWDGSMDGLFICPNQHPEKSFNCLRCSDNGCPACDITNRHSEYNPEPF